MADISGGSITTNNKELRIVMVGKTGVGKSATGNTILGQDHFDSKFSAESMTVDCAKGRAFIDRQNVSVIDTAGLFNTRFDDGKSLTSLKQCVKFASPGPHIFLVVIRLGRFTDEEKQTVQKVQEMFGQSADRYSMVLFTGGDLLEGPFNKFLARSKNLQELVDKCNGNYHVFNNKSKDLTQVTELLQKIQFIVQKNGGSHYTNEMFQEAEREVEAEKQRILKENEEKIRRERERLDGERQRKFMERLDKMMRTFQAERERERKERENERKREREMYKERKREMTEIRKERQKEREEKQRMIDMMMERMRANYEKLMNEERSSLLSAFEEHKENEAQWRAEREREWEEREEEWKRERKEMIRERRREMEEKDEERRREMKEMYEEISREREEKERLMTKMMDHIKEKHQRHLVKERRRLQEQREEIDNLKEELSKRPECIIS